MRVLLAPLLVLLACSPSVGLKSGDPPVTDRRSSSAQAAAQPVAVRAAAAYAAALAGADPGEGSVSRVEEVTWPDPSLGCAHPMLEFPPVETRGFRVVIVVRGAERTVHVNRAGTSLAICEDDMGADEAGSTPGEANDRVREELAQALGVSAADLELESREVVVWSDGAIGCPEPGMLYTQATVPGVRMVFRTPSGQRVEVHATRDLARWLECRNGRPGVGSGTRKGGP